jgi:methylated-DNA-[protein]-cysteine S-methyltransferase
MAKSEQKERAPAVATVNTPLGKFCIAAGPKGICMVAEKDLKKFKNRGSCKPKDAKTLVRTVKELEQYFQGKRKNFTVAVDLSSGTPFQQKVWRELMKIPYGHVITYGELSKRIGKPGAARAVGQAVGSNPNGIIVPCHRVVASGNRIGGWSGGGGIAGKIILLMLEGSDFFKVKKIKKN